MKTSYRKKPVVIQAWQLPEDVASVANEAPAWLVEALLNNGARVVEDAGTMEIRTLEGTLTANAGDWIIQGVKGEIYPCKPDIFAATYEDA